MEEKPFPWTGIIEKDEVNHIATQAPKLASASWLQYLKTNAPVLLLGLFLLGIFIFKHEKKSEHRPTSFSVDALVLMLPVGKGSIILTETLKNFPINPKSLTKTQAFQLVMQDDLLKLQGRVRAKKTLPPNKPLFWSDLEIIPANLPKRPSQIIFSKESS